MTNVAEGTPVISEASFVSTAPISQKAFSGAKASKISVKRLMSSRALSDKGGSFDVVLSFPGISILLVC
ncbi:hypothetical protein [Qipengyuania citrea]|uniref:hypothetical protein n=1 Tax=Qipengyuania citrea TaxID=225971 RepID=UPI003264C08D